MILTLGPQHWLNTHQNKIRSLHPVFLADITFGDNAGTFRCYVKLCRPETAVLFNEAASWLLAKACGVPVASRAAIMRDVPVARLAGHSLPTWIYNQNSVSAWVCQALPGRPASMVFAAGHVQDELLKNREGQKIAAFDEWTYNSDRHNGNVHHCSRTGWHAFDHSEGFSGHLWPLLAEHFGIIAPNVTVNLQKTLDQYQKTKRWRTLASELVNASAVHQPTFLANQRPIGELAELEHGKHASATVLSFLAQRARPNWMADLLKVI